MPVPSRRSGDRKKKPQASVTPDATSVALDAVESAGVSGTAGSGGGKFGAAYASFRAEIEIRGKLRVVTCVVEFHGPLSETEPGQIVVKDVVDTKNDGSLLHLLRPEEIVSVKGWAAEYFAMMGCDIQEGYLPPS